MEANNKTIRVDLNGHVFYSRHLNDEFTLLTTEDSLIKSAMLDLNEFYENVVDLAYDGEDAEYTYIGEDGEEYFGEDAQGVTLFFVHTGMLQFRICPDCGRIAFMVHQEKAKLKEEAVRKFIEKRQKDMDPEEARKLFVAAKENDEEVEHDAE